MKATFRQIAAQALDRALAYGAEEVRARISWGTHASISRREGRIETMSEAISQGLSLSLMVDGRFSTHGTSDLRPDALDAFLRRAIAATRVLEPDPDRRMPDRSEQGLIPDEALDLDDPSFASRDPETRLRWSEAMEAAVRDDAPADCISNTCQVYEALSQSYSLWSNGFEVTSQRTHFGAGAEATLKEPDGKLPETYSGFSSYYLSDLPDVKAISVDLWDRALEVRGMRPAPSGVYPLILANHAAGRILGAILGPLSGGALWQGRSIYLGKIGQDTPLASTAFTLIDDPLIPRSSGARRCDGDGFLPVRRAIFEEGRLLMGFYDLYHARKTGEKPTTGGSSNLVIAPGPSTWQDVARELPRAIRVTGFLGGNTNPVSGDFSLGVTGQLLERGEVVHNISEMNLSGNLLDLLQRYRLACSDVWVWSSARVPSLVFDNLQFSGV